ncbi:hypothetical protein C2S52_000317 [Perilla frutescens var. hirtella]|nr:hypothetical protein C2S51_008080 [Perilla frutescens var. frutescens]KAH6799853.1 hypothetical protein C2S52_000317 [Perilla frutescens var. hirtella]
MDELTHSPSTQQSIKQARSIDDSIKLLDSCSSIRELAQMMRENIQALQSALRRRGGSEYSGIQNDVASYISCRKKMNKCIKRSLKALKNSENEMINASMNLVHEESFINRVLREVYGLTIAIFKRALLFFSTSPAAVKSGGWNLVSRLMLSKAVDHSVVSEVGCVDFAVSNLQGGVKNGDSKIDVDHKQMLQRSLQNLDSCVEGIEEGLGRMYRRLLQTRVDLLNIVTNH